MAVFSDYVRLHICRYRRKLQLQLLVVIVEWNLCALCALEKILLRAVLVFCTRRALQQVAIHQACPRLLRGLLSHVFIA